MKSTLVRSGWRLSSAILVLGVVLCSSCVSPGTPPVIESLGMERDWVEPSGRSEIKCVAFDPDGDSLTYTWSASGGTFFGTRSTVTWLAPDAPGEYIATVTVIDSTGAEATAEITLEVRVNHPPVIESLTAESSVVEQARSTGIECIAYDPDGDEVDYQWTTTGGNISGQGSTVTWIAPNTCGDYVVTVTVVDSGGSEVTEELKIKVTKPG